MVICMVIGCLKQSDRDKRISFYRIPAVIRHCPGCEFELSMRRRGGFLAAACFKGRYRYQRVREISNFVPATSYLESLLDS